jgi:hypothetical protein
VSRVVDATGVRTCLSSPRETNAPCCGREPAVLPPLSKGLSAAANLVRPGPTGALPRPAAVRAAVRVHPGLPARPVVPRPARGPGPAAVRAVQARPGRPAHPGLPARPVVPRPARRPGPAAVAHPGLRLRPVVVRRLARLVAPGPVVLGLVVLRLAVPRPVRPVVAGSCGRPRRPGEHSPRRRHPRPRVGAMTTLGSGTAGPRPARVGSDRVDSDRVRGPDSASRDTAVGRGSGNPGSLARPGRPGSAGVKPGSAPGRRGSAVGRPDSLGRRAGSLGRRAGSLGRRAGSPGRRAGSRGRRAGSAVDRAGSRAGSRGSLPSLGGRAMGPPVGSFRGRRRPGGARGS